MLTRFGLQDLGFRVSVIFFLRKSEEIQDVFLASTLWRVSICNLKVSREHKQKEVEEVRSRSCFGGLSGPETWVIEVRYHSGWFLWSVFLYQ